MCMILKSTLNLSINRIVQVEGECYLFDCGTPEDFTCVFDHHARFMSGALEVNRHQFEKISRGHQGKWINFASFTGDNVGSCYLRARTL